MEKEIEKEAYLMINAYGKAEAERIANERVKLTVQDIRVLPFYNAAKVELMNKRVFFWLAVANAIKNWP